MAMQTSLVLHSLARYLDFDTLKNGRNVSSSWMHAFQRQFLKLSQLKINLESSSADLFQICEKITKSNINTVCVRVAPILRLDKEYEHLFLWPTIGSIVTNLTLGSCEDSLENFQLNICTLKWLLKDWCPRITDLTIINAEAEHYSHVWKFSQVFKPTIVLKNVTILSTRNSTYFQCQWKISRFWHLVDLVLNMLFHVDAVTLQFNDVTGQHFLFAPPTTYILKSVKYFSIINTAPWEDQEFCLYIENKLQDSDDFSNLRELKVRHDKFILKHPWMRNVFSQLEALDLEASTKNIFLLADDIKNVTTLRLKVSNWLWFKVRMTTDDQSLYERKFQDLCPNLTTLELEEVTYFDADNNLRGFDHLNVHTFKAHSSKISYLSIHKYFPNLKNLEVNLIQRKDAKIHVRFISFLPNLKSLKIIESALADDFQKILNECFMPLMTGLEKLTITTLNTSECRSPDFLNFFLDSYLNNKTPHLTFLKLKGFQVCSEQYDAVKHRLPFYFEVI